MTEQQQPAPEVLTITREEFDAKVRQEVATAVQAIVDDLPEPEVFESATETKGYAVYDMTYLRFLGDTYDTAAKARKAAKDAGVDVFEVREV